MCQGLVSYFNELRNFTGSIDNPITMAVILDWQAHSYCALARWEREAMFAMDRALRHSYYDVVRWHGKRKQIKVEDKDKSRKWQT